MVKTIAIGRLKILQGRQSIPEITHIFDYDNPSYLSAGDVNLEVWGYSLTGLPNRDPDNNIYQAFITCTDSQAMFNRPSSEVNLFPNLTAGGDRSLAVLFPKFTGFETTFQVLSENKMLVYIPSIVKHGCFEIILLNRAGYTRSGAAMGKYACTQSDLPDNWSSPIGLLKQSGENILRQGDTSILINVGDNPSEEIDRYAGDTPCTP